MKKGLHLGALGTAMPWESALAAIRAWGYDGVELILSPHGRLTLDSSDREILRMARELQNAGLSVVGVTNALLWHMPLTSDCSKRRAAGLRSLIRQAEICSLLGTDAALVIPGYTDTIFVPQAESIPLPTALSRAFEGISAALPAAQQLQVRLLIENVWNGFLLTPLQMRSFIDQFHSPAVGQYMDVGNILRDGDPAVWADVLGRRIGRVHVKDFRQSIGTMEGFCDLLTGDADYPCVMQSLRRIGYDGFLTVELHHETGSAACQRASQALDRILQMT